MEFGATKVEFCQTLEVLGGRRQTGSVPMNRGALAAALAIAGTLTLAGSRAAADPPGIAFADPDPLSPSQGDLNDGVTVSVCNSSSDEATVTMRLEGFEFTTEGEESTSPLPETDVVTIDPPSTTIRPGECRDFLLMTPDDAVELAEPSYEGSVLAVSNGVGSAMLALTVPGTSAATKPDAAVGDVDLHASFDGRWNTKGTATARNGITLRFKGEDPPPMIEGGAELGVLARGSGSARLLAASDSRDVNGVVEVDVKLVGASGNGTYVGQMDPAIAGSDDKPISIAMTVADQWYWSALVCLLGLVAGVLAKVATGRWRVLMQWKRFRDKFERKYIKADAALEKNNPVVARRFKRPSPETIRARCDDLDKRTVAYRKTTFLFDTASKSYKAVADGYASVGEDIRRLASETDDGLGAAIKALDKRIDKFVVTFNRNFPTRQPPTILGTAKGIAGYHGIAEPEANRADAKELPVGGAAKVVADAAAAVAMLDNWEKLATRFRRCRMWAFMLREKAPTEPALDALYERIAELDHELFESVTSDDLTTAEVDKDLGRVYRRLSVLSGRHNVYLPSDWEERDRETECSPEGQASVVYITGALQLSEDDVKGLIEALPPMEAGSQPEVSEQWTATDTAAAILLEGLIVLGAVLTLFIAVTKLYVDQPFGSLSDYAAVFALGIGAELVIGWFVQAVSGWRAPIEVAEPKPA